MDCKKESNKLKSSAHHIEETSKPLTRLSAIKIITALIIRRKSPKVRIVIGSVKNIKIGFTNNRKRARTSARIIAEPYPSMCIPGKILARITTARAVNKSLKMSFIKKF